MSKLRHNFGPKEKPKNVKKSLKSGLFKLILNDMLEHSNPFPIRCAKD